MPGRPRPGPRPPAPARNARPPATWSVAGGVEVARGGGLDRRRRRGPAGVDAGGDGVGGGVLGGVGVEVGAAVGGSHPAAALGALTADAVVTPRPNLGALLAGVVLFLIVTREECVGVPLAGRGQQVGPALGVGGALLGVGDALGGGGVDGVGATLGVGGPPQRHTQRGH